MQLTMQTKPDMIKTSTEPAIDAHHSMTGGNMSRSIDYTSSVETSNITSATVTVNYDPFQNMTSGLNLRFIVTNVKFAY